MLKRIALSTALAASALTALPAAAEAQSRYGYYDGYGNGYYQGYDRRAYNQRYYNQRRYSQRYYNHYGTRCSGSTGTIIGAIAGGLLGREISRSGNNGYYGRRSSGTTGAIIGGAIGALAGREIDRGNCRR